MAEEDNFDIDIYGDDAPGGEGDYNNDNEQPVMQQAEHGATEETSDAIAADVSNNKSLKTAEEKSQQSSQDSNKIPTAQPRQPVIVSSSGPSPKDSQTQKGSEQISSQKDGAADRMNHSGSSALTISDLGWWVTEDDIRGWANQCKVEGDLKEITFSEHKVNGKCKGQAYVEFKSPQAASAVKQKIETLNDDQASSAKKMTVIVSSSAVNPFRTLPKDAQKGQNSGPNSLNNNRDRGGPASFGGPAGPGNFNNNSGFRNNRGGMNNRGNLNNNNRNFSGSGMNMGMQNGSGFAGSQMGFGGPMGGGSFNNYNRQNMMGPGAGMRGAMQSRGVRGGGGMNMMNSMPMAMGGMNTGMYNMGMGGMPSNMGMSMGMGGGFGGPQQGHFNPAFFSGQQTQMGPGGTGNNNGDWNPHGAKRPRPE